MYALKENVYACSDNGSIILLDLRGNQYFSIEESRAPALLAPMTAPPDARVSAMAARGLLGAMPLVHVGSAPLHPIVHGDLPLRPVADAVTSWPLFARFIVACLRAQAALRRRRLDLTFKALARLRRPRRGHAGGDIAADVATYERLRPWYPMRRVCLFDSLSLSYFLLGLGHRPNLVLGVRAQPFSAHCWVEADGLCLNDSAGLCRTYTPIAVA